MKELVIISGKGGTGKTSLTGSFASLSSSGSVMVDADVDAANLSLICNPVLLEKHEFRSSEEAAIDLDKCLNCELCRELCRYEAIPDNYVVDPLKCEGCKVCFYACPHEAISMVEKLSGHWFISQTNYGTLVHARLGVAEENSGKLVTTIRSAAKELAGKEGKELIIIDGPPGIGCPVIASLSGVDAALVVTEPSVSGIHDMDRVLDVCNHFKVEAAVCINRYDLHLNNTQKIEDYCRNKNIKIAGKVPFDNIFIKALAKGKPVTEYVPHHEVADIINDLWNNFTR